MSVWCTYMFSGEGMFMCMEVACVNTKHMKHRGETLGDFGDDS